MEIPAYIIRNVLRHMEVVVSRCTADRLDNRAANALRMIKQDIAQLRKHYDNYLLTNNTTNKNESTD